jgi:hypothetical protein
MRSHQAVLLSVGHGFTPDQHRIDHWRGGPVTIDIGTVDIGFGGVQDGTGTGPIATGR